MKRLLVALALATVACRGTDDEDAQLKLIAKGIKDGVQESLAGLHDCHGEKAAKLVLDAVRSDRVGAGLKARMAEIAATWPVSAPGRASLLDWITRHPNCSDDELLFFASLRLRETRSFFWTQIEQIKGDPAKLRQPQRVAMAVMALGFFEDNPEPVVTRIGSLLAEDYPHVIRACSADALGGMRHRAAVEALIPHVQDDAVGPQVVRSLYRLTGQHFDRNPPEQWRDWLAENPQRIDFKMHTQADFDNFLKMQALLNPDDDSVTNMDTFYGIDLRGKAMLFILDVSGSMTTDDRISKLRAQMSNILVILGSRSEKLRFGIAIFGDDVRPCFPRGIMANDEANRRKAVRFVEDLQADGGTPMVEVLDYANRKILPDANVDTIYFLSDGAPSDGTPEMVLDITRRIFQQRQIRFNTISIGEDTPEVFGEQTLLQQMAELTGGTFTQPR
ncbi:MAG: VWA domain-containing protein [Prosthecobacter sp.]